MLKLLGGICILIACAGLGRMKAAVPEKRQRMLQGVGQGLLALMREMEYAAPMSRALRAAASSAGTAEDIFLAAANAMQNGEGTTAEEAWRSALETQQPDPKDRALLSIVGDGLGAGELQSQLHALELSRLRIAEAETAAKEEAERYGRVWKTVGWSCGGILALLLL